MESHLSLEDVVAAVDGRLTPAERSGIDEHLAACAICRAEYAEVALLSQTAPPVVASRHRWLPAAGLVAAAAVVFAVALPLTRHPNGASRSIDQRAPANESVVPIVSPSPATAIPRDSLRFTWRAATAATYRLIITDSTGAELYSSATSDTTLALPSSVVLQVGARYFWFVDELRADGTSVSSQASGFSIRP